MWCVWFGGGGSVSNPPPPNRPPPHPTLGPQVGDDPRGTAYLKELQHGLANDCKFAIVDTVAADQMPSNLAAYLRSSSTVRALPCLPQESRPKSDETHCCAVRRPIDPPSAAADVHAGAGPRAVQAAHPPAQGPGVPPPPPVAHRHRETGPSPTSRPGGGHSQPMMLIASRRIPALEPQSDPLAWFLSRS